MRWMMVITEHGVMTVQTVKSSESKEEDAGKRLSNTLNRSDSKLSAQIRCLPLSQDSTFPSLLPITKLFDLCSSDLLPLPSSQLSFLPPLRPQSSSSRSSHISTTFSYARYLIQQFTILSTPSSPPYAPSDSSLSPESSSLRTPIRPSFLD